MQQHFRHPPYNHFIRFTDVRSKTCPNHLVMMAINLRVTFIADANSGILMKLPSQEYWFSFSMPRLNQGNKIFLHWKEYLVGEKKSKFWDRTGPLVYQIIWISIAIGMQLYLENGRCCLHVRYFQRRIPRQCLERRFHLI